SNRWAAFAASRHPWQAFFGSLGRIIRSSGTYQIAERISDRMVARAAASRPRAAPERELAAQVVAVYGENTRLVGALAASYKFRSLFYWQPAVSTRPRLTTGEPQEARLHGGAGEFSLAPTTAARADRQLAAPGNFRDLSGVFQDHPEALFIDYVH